MRLRYKLVTYHFGQDASGRQTVQRHYQALMDELLRQGQHPAVNHRTVQWRPPADIHETPEAVRVKMELAGMSEEDIEITLYEDALVVTGRRDDVERDEAVYYHEAQIRYGPFRAEILLPGPVRREEVEARYANGFLCITLPKVTDARAGEGRADVAGVARSATPSQPLQAGADPRAPDAADTAGAPSPVDALPRGARFAMTLRGGPCDA